MTTSKFHRLDPSAPLRKGAAIVLDTPFRESDAIGVSVAGNINVTWPDGTTSIIGVSAGIQRLAITNIATASTTATGLSALWLND